MTWLLVADAGGHLALLSWLAPLFRGDQRTWVTTDRPDARARLAGEAVVYGSAPTTRSVRAWMGNQRRAHHLLRHVRPDVVLTTGAALAVPFVMAARRAGVPSVFLEVVDRVDRPSLSGRLVQPFATAMAVQLPRQQALYPGSVMVGEVVPPSSGPQPEHEEDSVYVSVGTHAAPMDRLVALAETLAARGHLVRLQHGASRPGFGCDNHAFVSPEQHRRWVGGSRWVVLHGGSSSLAEARALGRRPLVVPRDPAYGEHVDDHQLRYARHHGLAVSPDHILRTVADGAVVASLPRPDRREALDRLRQLVQAVSSSAAT